MHLPVLLYNIPGRTGANLEPATVLRLAEIPNIIGIKESSGNMVQITELLTQAPRAFQVLAGDDALALPILSVGGMRPRLGRVERHPAADVADGERRTERQLDLRAAHQSPLLPPDAGELLRAQPGSHQSRHGAARPWQRGAAVADGPRDCDDSPQAGAHPRRAGPADELPHENLRVF